ncbi:protein MGARP [Talpa occidentalis]|uniref:protein MGARP n=1 Tax=Talpa occidentalis TaxID=50954 RepID=UPI00188F0D4B|nr:protein MGARP [Talpa occidentalis]
MSLLRALSRALAPRGPAPPRKHASLRWISFNKFPGSSGSNVIYYLAVGITVSAGGYYAYRRIVPSDQAKHIEHVANFRDKTRAELHPPQGEKESLAGAEKASLAAPVVSFLEAEVVDAQEIPEATMVMVAVPEETAACPGQVEAAQMESPPGPEAPKAAARETKDVRPDPATEAAEAAPGEAAAIHDDKSTAQKESSGEPAKLEEECCAMQTESSAREGARGEAGTAAEASSEEG